MYVNLFGRVGAGQKIIVFIRRWEVSCRKPMFLLLLKSIVLDKTYLRRVVHNFVNGWDFVLFVVGHWLNTDIKMVSQFL